MVESEFRPLWRWWQIRAVHLGPLILPFVLPRLLSSLTSLCQGLAWSGRDMIFRVRDGVVASQRSCEDSLDLATPTLLDAEFLILRWHGQVLCAITANRSDWGLNTGLEILSETSYREIQKFVRNLEFAKPRKCICRKWPARSSEIHGCPCKRMRP